jgi:LIVCS family branched-chain amino acid:cation transporter
MEKVSNKNLLFVSLMLFSMFFGAGNLIFPPSLGEAAGTNVWVALAGFLVSAVGLPVLGVAAVAKSGGLQNLASRVSAKFAVIFTVVIFLAIGPFLAIPRAGSLAFEMGVAPFLPKGAVEPQLALFLYTLAYFALAFWLCLNPTKLVDRMGKLLTPALLVLIALLFVSTLVKPLGSLSAPTGDYATMPFFKGFLDGYMTMDTIAALNFGIVISVTFMQLGLKNEKVIISSSIKAGAIVGVFLAVIYGVLAYLGAASPSMFGASETGAKTLTNVALYLFGDFGAVVLGLIFALACLTTSVGLITSCGQYFSQLFNKVSYKQWVVVLTVSSTLFANLGLSTILKFSVPVLVGIYPLAIALIALAFTHNFFKGHQSVYVCTMLFVGVMSGFDALKAAGYNLPALTKVFQAVPLFSLGVGWVVPGLVGAFLGYMYAFSKEVALKKPLDNTEKA